MPEHHALPQTSEAPRPFTRSQLLRRSGTGFGLLGLASLLQQTAAAESVNPLQAKPSHITPRASRVVHLFMNGGPSQVDTFDYKPELQKRHGQPMPSGNLRTERLTGGLMKSPFRFRPYGESGLLVSDMFRKTAAHIDDMAVIRSMHAEVPNHEPFTDADELR